MLKEKRKNARRKPCVIGLVKLREILMRETSCIDEESAALLMTVIRREAGRRSR